MMRRLYLSSAMLAAVIVANPASATNVFVRGDAQSVQNSAPGDLKANAASVTFPETEVYLDQPIIPVTLSNDGAFPVRITELLLRAAPSAKLQIVGDGCAADTEIGAHATCILSLKWSPTAPQRIAATLIVRHTGPSKELAVQINGVAKVRADTRLPAALQATPTAVKLGPDKNNGGRITRAQTVVLTNTLSQPLPIDSIALLTEDPSLDISKGSCVGIHEIPAKSSCDLRVSWRQGETGWKTDILVSYANSRNVLPIPVEIGQPDAPSPGATSNAMPPPLPTAGAITPAPAPAFPDSNSLLSNAFGSGSSEQLVLRGFVSGAAIIKLGDQVKVVPEGSTLRYKSRDWIVTVAGGAVALTSRAGTETSRIVIRVGEEPEYLTQATKQSARSARTAARSHQSGRSANGLAAGK